MKYDIEFKYFPQKVEIPSAAVKKGMNVCYYGVLYYIMAGYDDTALVASMLEIEEKKVIEGFNYFSEKGIITLSNPRTSEQVAEEKKKEDKKKEKVKIELKLKPTDLSEMRAKDPELEKFISGIEESLKRPVKINELAKYVEIYQNCQLDAAAIATMIAYFKEQGKDRVAYISKVAYDWAAQDITSYKQVEEKIKELESRRSFEQMVIRIFGVKANKLSEAQSKYCEKWIKLGIDSEEMLSYAYNRCLDGINGFNWKYADKIITGWAENGIFTLEKAEQAQKEHDKEKAEKYDDKDKKYYSYSSRKRKRSIFNDDFEEDDYYNLDFEKDSDDNSDDDYYKF